MHLTPMYHVEEEFSNNCPAKQLTIHFSAVKQPEQEDYSSFNRRGRNGEISWLLLIEYAFNKHWIKQMLILNCFSYLAYAVLTTVNVTILDCLHLDEN